MGWGDASAGLPALAGLGVAPDINKAMTSVSELFQEGVRLVASQKV